VAIQRVIEGGKLTYHHLRNAVFTAAGEPDGTFSDTPQVDRTLKDYLPLPHNALGASASATVQ
jgi:hypothetical protein